MTQEPKITAALIYDFDGTLAPGNMQEYDFIPAVGQSNREFWNDANSLAEEQDADMTLTYMAKMLEAARYASDGHDFAANNRLLLRNLEGVANRRARFRTVISLLVGDEEHLFEGVVEGRIVERESGAEGFGYDPLFVPDGCDRTFAEMSPDEKNAVSHRGRAVRKLAAFLRARGEK